jgi:hypothetical protein
MQGEQGHGADISRMTARRRDDIEPTSTAD